MDFEFSPQQQALRDKVRGYVTDRLGTAARESDRAGRFVPGLLAEIGDQGLYALRIPTAYGGSGLDAVSTGVVVEELARGDVTACYAVLNAALTASILTANATPEQCARWLPPIARGTAVVAFCMTEDGHGTDAAALELRAEPTAEGWSLTGEKTSIMLAADATHGLVFARTGTEPRARGVTAFYVPLDDPRITRTRLRDFGSRHGGRSTVVFDGVPVPAADLVGGPGLGFAQGMRGFDYSRALIALIAVSAARASLDEALAYARTRQAFGQPLGTFQGVAFPLVEQATYLHAARMLAFEALWRNDNGLDHRIEANMAKWWAPRVAVEAAHQALLTLGQRAWSEERDLARRLRDVIGTQLADGTANATKIVVARLLLGREYAP
ncbi:MAG: acyl-CoA dehydrogenase [Actinobacteria bacterium 13_2_20CM_2_71_6]|nr:MAG: acyl-CoA dehydrogenase [Actinobacteria bacterium 13_2_20CM_2_71_6]